MGIRQQDGLVADFIMSQQPSRLLQAYRIIANLEYPIVDRHSLVCQLDEIPQKNENSGKQEKLIFDLIKDHLEPADFPIETPRSGLEKFHARLSQSLIVEPPFPRPLRLRPRPPYIPDVGPFLARPERSVRTEYIQRFGSRCGLEAYNTYLESRGLLTNPDADEVNAYFAGIRAGEACLGL
jgi:hypothetical protein